MHGHKMNLNLLVVSLNLIDSILETVDFHIKVYLEYFKDFLASAYCNL